MVGSDRLFVEWGLDGEGGEVFNGKKSCGPGVYSELAVSIELPVIFL